jgi:hypothetical protein
MWTRAFWKGTAERAVSTAAQAGLAVVGADTAAEMLGFDSFQAPWLYVGSVALGGAILSVGKSLAAAYVGDKGTPSLVRGGE